MVPGISGHVVTACVVAASGAARVATETANLSAMLQASQASQQHKQTAQKIATDAKVLKEELDAFLAVLLA